MRTNNFNIIIYIKYYVTILMIRIKLNQQFKLTIYNK